jgi:hypothetical protein
MVSLFVSFSLDPMLSAYWPDPHIATEDRPWLSRQLAHFNVWFNHQADRYKRVISWALRHRFAMALLAVGSFVTALAMPALGLLGGEFFPVSDNSEFCVCRRRRDDSRLHEKKMEEVSTSPASPASIRMRRLGRLVGGRGCTSPPRLQAHRERTWCDRARLQEVGGAHDRDPDQGSTTETDSGPNRGLRTVLTRLRISPGTRGAWRGGRRLHRGQPEMDVRADRDHGSSRVGDAQALRPASPVYAGDWSIRRARADVTVRRPRATRQADLSSLPLVFPTPRDRHA